MMEANSLAYDYTDGKTQLVVRLRPHHLLCLQNFRGKGYSPAFVEKMTEVSARLGLSPGGRSDGQSPGAAILLVQGADDLCKSCPNCIDGQCSSQKPARFDGLVLETCGISYGRLLPDGIKSPDFPRMSRHLLEKCCPGCEWLDLCFKICS